MEIDCTPGTAKIATNLAPYYDAHSEAQAIRRINVNTLGTQIHLAIAKTRAGFVMLMDDFFNAVDRVFAREADRIPSRFRLELKTSLELPLSAPESPQGTRTSERPRTPERRLQKRRLLR